MNSFLPRAVLLFQFTKSENWHISEILYAENPQSMKFSLKSLKREKDKTTILMILVEKKRCCHILLVSSFLIFQIVQHFPNPYTKIAISIVPRHSIYLHWFLLVFVLSYSFPSILPIYLRKFWMLHNSSTEPSQLQALILFFFLLEKKNIYINLIFC